MVNALLEARTIGGLGGRKGAQRLALGFCKEVFYWAEKEVQGELIRKTVCGFSIQ